MSPLLPMPILAPLLVAAVLAVIAANLRSTTGCRPRLRGALLALRLAGVAVLVLAALNPGSWVQPDPPRREWAVMVDRSASMAVADAGGISRFAAAREFEKTALAQSRDPARVQRYTFAERLDADARADAPAGLGTDAVTAVGELLARAQSTRRPLAGILVIGDGRQTRRTDAAATAVRARAMSTPVATFVLGGPVRVRDLSITPARAHTAGLAGRPVTLRAMLRNRGMGPARPEVRLLDPAGRVLAETRADIGEGEEREVALEVPAADRGTRELAWDVAAPTADDLPANNRAPVLVTSVKGPVRVLIAEGQPHWDTKFLAQLLRRNAAFEVTTIHRLAPDRFYRVGGTAAAEPAGTSEPFPSTDEDLAAFDLVVIGRGAGHFLTPARATLLLRFLRDHGGGLLFARGRPDAVEVDGLSDLEPAEWGGDAADVAAKWRPTPAGVESGLFQGALPGPTDPDWALLPPLSPQFKVKALKPFSSVLAIADVEGSTAKEPFVLARRIGRGVCVTVNARDFWRWDFFSASGKSSAFYKAFWPELAQWLSLRGDLWPGMPVGLVLETDAAPAGEPVKATVRMRAPTATPPALTLFAPGREPVSLTPQPGGEPGTWTTLVSHDSAGLLRLHAAVGEGEPAVAALRVLPPPGEADEPGADPQGLGDFATACGGAAVAADGLGALIRSWEDAGTLAVSARAPVFDPAWDRSGLLALAALAFAGEWFLRRRSGLA